jgi:hypothetical protein
MTTLLILAVALIAQTPQGNVPAPSAETQPMSLAERAAAARKAAAERNHAAGAKDTDDPPELTSEQRGAVRGTQYVNDVLHCKLDLANEWEQLSAERVARDEETARRFVNPDQRPSPYRVLWIGDAGGRNVAVSVVPVSPTMPSELGEVAAKLKQVSRAQLAKAEDLVDETEPILLGDVKHKFAAFRLKYSIRGTPIVQSGQVTRSNGLLMMLTVTGSSDQDVAEALRSLNSRLSWTEARP